MRISIVVALLLAFSARAASPAETAYFPPPESQGGWRKLDNPDDIRIQRHERTDGSGIYFTVTLSRWVSLHLSPSIARALASKLDNALIQSMLDAEGA